MSIKTSLSAGTATPTKRTPIQSLDGPDRPPRLSVLDSAKKSICNVEQLSIAVNDGPDGAVPGFVHISSNFERRTSNSSSSSRTAAILLSGAGGGLVGPSSIYLSMATKLASLDAGIPALRMDYRYPARNKYCVQDVEAAMSLLEADYGLDRVVLVGWSFEGAPVFTVGGNNSRVVGCATVASQTAETEGIRRLAPRPILLLHRTGDRCLSYSCSERLHAMYGSKGDRRIHLFDGDDHALTRNAFEAELELCSFVMRCAGVNIQDGEKDIVGKQLISKEERINKMVKGGDLKGEERIY
ncbi:uncharacterized protein K452DRAFT_313405 [Aplosporella prunicola CBS 121167]|uniref:AB hydrolase-1 domain-containing protein n=1 Tax=Aplosporella prunicola CBS 121167 TaxID=1176127 RepID=A0A6A6B0C5_9PEZI|nr:uncharacterized protein K452DRAFT_313405 [Aplosporella prunicola CBS 121167]KAF2136161.1 hypothetical protein K452DRAFT_313405 [Aplosporella prunicola CBS 121167]